MECKHISFNYGKGFMMKDVSVTFKKGKITAIVGPNGSGKSTLLMLLSRIYQPTSGDIVLSGKNIRGMKTKEFAKQVAVVHQRNQIISDISIRKIVSYGRLPFRNYYQKLSEEDDKIIDWALKITNLSDYEHCMLDKLSGGQQQRVWLAMSLAQRTPVLLLDEPTTYLDIKYQIEILELIRKINRDYQITIILVHHDINQALCYSDEILAMKDGRVLFNGAGSNVISKSSLSQLYDCEIEVITHKEKQIVLNFKSEYNNKNIER